MKRFLALTLALLIVMTMAACGGSGGKAADPNTLVVWHDKEAAVIEALQAYLDKALPDITVRFEKKTSLTDSLKLVGNDPSSAPDLFVFAHDKIGVFAEMGILTPVTELISQSELSGYLPMTLEAATYNGSLYQLPLYFETLLFMYNRRYMHYEELPAPPEELLAYMIENTAVATALWSSTAPPITALHGFTALAAALSMQTAHRSPISRQSRTRWSII